MSGITYPNAVAPAAERRTISIAVVAALHIAVIYVILAALNIVPSPVSQDGPIHLRFIDKKTVVDPQPPPTIQDGRLIFTHPTAPPANPPPIPFDPGTGGTGTYYPPPQPPGQGIFNPASAVPGTHTIPAFPSLDRRLGHQGAALLNIAIDEQGYVSDASVAQSSGYEGLDMAAIAWVKEHWRYRPAMRDGNAVPSTTRASVVFRLTQTGY